MKLDIISTDLFLFFFKSVPKHVSIDLEYKSYNKGSTRQGVDLLFSSYVKRFLLKTEFSFKLDVRSTFETNPSVYFLQGKNSGSG